MTGKLAWPLTAMIIGLVFRRPLTQLLERVHKLKWGEKEAELNAFAEVEESIQDAVDDFAKPLPEDEEKSKQEWRNRITRLVQDGVNAGYRFAKKDKGGEVPPYIVIRWEGDSPKIAAAVRAGYVDTVYRFMQKESQWPLTVLEPTKEHILKSAVEWHKPIPSDD